jgi:hypothetical protein
VFAKKHLTYKRPLSKDVDRFKKEEEVNRWSWVLENEGS